MQPPPIVIPALSTQSATLLCAFFTLSYVGSLYLARAGRLAFHAPPIDVPNGQERVRIANEQWRNDPSVIRARLTAVTISTVLSCAVLGAVVIWTAGDTMPLVSPVRQLAVALGFSSYQRLDIQAVLFAHLLTPWIFIGPLFVMFLSSALPFQSNWSYGVDIVEKFTSWQGIRNYIVAPITEEIVFRSCIIAAMRLSGASKARMIWVAPLWFGVAHAHHAWGLYNMFGRTRSALKRAVLTALIQLAYTTLFGWFTSWLFVTGGYIYPAITSHIFCNIMGLPSPSYGAHIFPTYATAIWTLHAAPLMGFLISVYQHQ